MEDWGGAAGSPSLTETWRGCQTTAESRTECVGGGAWGGAGSKHSRDTQGGKGPATVTFLSSQKNYKQMWMP
jgi:hypothetical protein